jgi:hypothetical protein
MEISEKQKSADATEDITSGREIPKADIDLRFEPLRSIALLSSTLEPISETS